MAQSQTPPNTMIVVNFLPLKKKTKNTFFFQPPFEILTSFSSLFLVSCLCRCIHHYFCSLHTSHEGRSRVFAIHSCEWAEEEMDLKLCMCVCTCTERQMCVCHSVPTAECSTLSLFSHPTRSGLSVTHCFTQFTICTCPPSSHLFVSHAVLHRLCFLSFLVASSVSFLFFSNLISIFSPQPSFCTGLSLIICVFPPSWKFHDSVEWCMSFLW